LVIDTSALLAILLQEELGPWTRDQLNAIKGPVWMSAINYAETLIVIGDRRVGAVHEIRKMIAGSRIEVVPPTAEHAELAAAARLRFPLNLGDCFAYSLAKFRMCPLLTLDRDFRNCDVKLIFPRIH
jgi:ribonuclease VapC